MQNWIQSLYKPDYQNMFPRILLLYKSFRIAFEHRQAYSDSRRKPWRQFAFKVEVVYGYEVKFVASYFPASVPYVVSVSGNRMYINCREASVSRAFPYCRFHVFLALGNFVWFFATNFKPARGNLRKITHRNFAGDFLSLRKSWIDYKL